MEFFLSKAASAATYSIPHESLKKGESNADFIIIPGIYFFVIATPAKAGGSNLVFFKWIAASA
jgi:hypothetical protein